MRNEPSGLVERSGRAFVNAFRAAIDPAAAVWATMIPFTWRHGFEEGFREGQEVAGTQTLHYRGSFDPADSIEKAAKQAAEAAAGVPGDPDFYAKSEPLDGPTPAPDPAKGDRHTAALEQRLEVARRDYKLLEEQLSRMAVKYDGVAKSYVSIMESLGLRYATMTQDGFAKTEAALELLMENGRKLREDVTNHGGAVGEDEDGNVLVMWTGGVS